MPKVILFRDPACLQHDTGHGHPECADRIRAIDAGLHDSGVEEQVTSLAPEDATRDDLCRVHRPDYVDHILALRGRHLALDADTHVSPGSTQAALLAAGAAIGAVDVVLDAPGRIAFSLMRPPGHHAEADRAMGFCLFNNAAVAAAYALAQKGLKRVLIFDPDVHHGNGTQHIFEERQDVFYISIHQYPFYPGTGSLEETGKEAGKGFTANAPLPPGLGDAEYLHLTQHLVLPLIDAYRPELVLVSAGFDAHAEDPLAQMEITDAGFLGMFGALGAHLESARIPYLFILEGGYSLPVLGRVVPALIQNLASGTFPRESPGEPHEAAVRAVKTLRPKEFHFLSNQGLQ